MPSVQVFRAKFNPITDGNLIVESVFKQSTCNSRSIGCTRSSRWDIGPIKHCRFESSHLSALSCRYWKRWSGGNKASPKASQSGYARSAMKRASSKRLQQVQSANSTANSTALNYSSNLNQAIWKGQKNCPAMKSVVWTESITWTTFVCFLQFHTKFDCSLFSILLKPTPGDRLESANTHNRIPSR